MVIGVIGAGLAGLVAGKTLAEAGHEVTVFDKSHDYGGRMATRPAGDNENVKFDYGTPFLQAEGEEYQNFLTELEHKGLIKKWCDYFSYHNDEAFYERHPGKDKKTCYMAPDGMAAIGKYLSRWMDFRLGVPVSGLTFIGSNRLSKRNWMITLSDINVFELDAIVIATPAVQAYGLIQTSQDETAFRRIIRSLSQIEYEPGFSVSASYGNRDIPQWKGIVCKDDRIQWISNENSKRENSGVCGLVIQSTGNFAYKHLTDDPNLVSSLMLESAGVVAGPWASKPHWHGLDLWKYIKPRNPLKIPYIELEDHPAPAALVGDYFGGETMESSYLSGLKLGRLWAEKFAMEKV